MPNCCLRLLPKSCKAFNHGALPRRSTRAAIPLGFNAAGEHRHSAATAVPAEIAPASSPTADAKSSVVGVPAAMGGTGVLVNINTATAAQLEALPKIGPAIALRIIEYRTQHGAFATLEALMNVKGIGPSTFEALRAFITITP